MWTAVSSVRSSNPEPGGGARLDLMRLCPEPAAYELGFTHTERPVVVAIAEIDLHARLEVHFQRMPPYCLP
jgi:hypothetical protein